MWTLLLASLGCGEQGPKATARTEAPPRKVRLMAAELAVLPRELPVPGVLAADERVDLGFRVAGRLDVVLVDFGSVVEARTPLARLDPETFDLEIQQAAAAKVQARVRLGLPALGDTTTVDPEQTALIRQARALLAEATLIRDRLAELVQQKLRPEADLDQAVAAYAVAESRLQEAQEELRNRQSVLEQRQVELAIANQRRQDTVLRAPFSGMVASRTAGPGEYVTPGQRILTLVKVDPLRLRLHVPDRFAGNMSLASTVLFTVDGDDGVFEGRILRLAPDLDVQTRTLLVEASVQNSDLRLRPGAFARARIRLAAGPGSVVVPKTALRRFAGIEKLIVAVNGKAEERVVRTGREDGSRVEIVMGLAEGELIVVEPGDLVTGIPLQAEG